MLQQVGRFFIFAPFLLVTGTPIITLQYGSFQGTTDGNLSTFLSVPFARPAGRFELPKTPTFIDGIQNATEFGAACPQQAPSPVAIPVPVPLPTYVISEDCLTLNVFKPRAASPHSKLPVFVWIYGGGFEFGNSADLDVRPVVERSIVKGDPIIIVTPNYRVSAFGFLSGKEAGEAGISNLGLRDQIFALQWVQKHIVAFGGDPERVIIGGISSGAASAAMLLLSNRRFEESILFRGAFMLSGSPITIDSLADGQSDYDGLVAANNCTHSDDTLACLRRVPFDDFMATVNRTTNVFSYSSLHNVWRPRIDGDVVVQDPLVSVSRGSYAKASIPVMTGDADDEGTIFSLSNTNITTSEEFGAYLQSNYLPEASAAQIAQLTVLYPDDPTQGSPFNTGTENQFTPQFKRLAAFQGDYSFIGARRFFLEHASRTQDTWSWGALHGSDMDQWFPSANGTNANTFAVDAMINFVNRLDPNINFSSGAQNTESTDFWPKWNTPSSDGPTSLLTFNDPNVVNVTAENFRAEPLRFLYDLLLKQAEKTG
ncbi:carotenoid ester lipase precursor [Mycena crocata]|nr:carotenoid ester lipase precursor [Mycena crocata]